MLDASNREINSHANQLTAPIAMARFQGSPFLEFDSIGASFAGMTKRSNEACFACLISIKSRNS